MMVILAKVVPTVTGVDMDDTVGFALGTVAACDKCTCSAANNYNNVLREAKALNGNNAANTSDDTNGQISVLEPMLGHSYNCMI